MNDPARVCVSLEGPQGQPPPVTIGLYGGLLVLLVFVMIEGMLLATHRPTISQGLQRFFARHLVWAWVIFTGLVAAAWHLVFGF